MYNFLSLIRRNSFWNFFDIIFTQAILILHNIFLKKIIGQYFHGALSIILSLFYLLTIILNLGLDQTLPLIIKENKNIKNILIKQSILITFLTLIIFFILIFLNKIELIDLNLINKDYSEKIDFFTLSIISIAFISENIRKTLRSFLQLILVSKVTALTETVGTYAVLFSIWSSYLLNININIRYCFILLLISSLIQNLILIYYFNKYNKYKSIDNKSFIKERFYNTLLQTSSQLFNSNFLIPICSLYLSLNTASNLRIYFSVIQFLSLIIVKNLSIYLNLNFLYNQKNFQHLFKIITEFFYKILAIIIIILLTNIKDIYTILFANFFIESIFILYEKIFILEKSSFLIFIINIFNIALISLFLLINCKYNYFQIYQIIIFMLSIRIFSIIILSLKYLKN